MPNANTQTKKTYTANGEEGLGTIHGYIPWYCQFGWVLITAKYTIIWASKFQDMGK